MPRFRAARPLLLLPFLLALYGRGGGAEEAAPSDQRLGIGSYRLHFRVWSGSEPWVLFESGGGAGADQWDSVASRIVQQTRSGVVTYDRAGFGSSDLPEMPYDIQAEIDALWDGLQRLAPNHAFVLVGHSYGAFLSELFAAKHSENVKGIILLDPNNIAFVDAIGGPDAVKRDPLIVPPYDRSRPDLLTKDQRAELRVFDGTDNLVTTMRSVAIPKAIPVWVITAGRPWWPMPERNQAWRGSHERLAASVTDGHLIVAERSGHRIDRDQPDLVVATVSDVIRLVGTNRAPGR
jgi:pimeloyl-ACP methyl ester carboxylesterase